MESKIIILNPNSGTSSQPPASEDTEQIHRLSFHHSHVGRCINQFRSLMVAVLVCLGVEKLKYSKSYGKKSKTRNKIMVLVSYQAFLFYSFLEFYIVSSIHFLHHVSQISLTQSLACPLNTDFHLFFYILQNNFYSTHFLVSFFFSYPSLLFHPSLFIHSFVPIQPITSYNDIHPYLSIHSSPSNQ